MGIGVSIFRLLVLSIVMVVASATVVDAVYAVVDKSRKKGVKKKTEDEPTVVNIDDIILCHANGKGD